jgi:hypothetical protein
LKEEKETRKIKQQRGPTMDDTGAEASPSVSMGDFDLSSQLADILNEPLFEALDSNRQRAPTDIDSLPMGDIELDFGFGEVDLQKIMEEEMGSKKQPPKLSLDTRAPMPPPVGHPPALMDSPSGSPVPGAAFASTLPAVSTSTFALDEEDDATQAAADGGDGEYQQRTTEKKEEDGDSVGGDDDDDDDDVLVEAEASELTPEHSLVKEITGTIEGRYLESLNELKLRELVRRVELGGGSDESANNRPAAQEDYPHGQETSEEAMHELEEELGKASPDLDRLRQLGRSYIIPESVRPALWKVRLDLPLGRSSRHHLANVVPRVSLLVGLLVQSLLGADKKPGDSMAGWEELLAAPLTPEEEKLVQACRDTRPELPGTTIERSAKRDCVVWPGVFKVSLLPTQNSETMACRSVWLVCFGSTASVAMSSTAKVFFALHYRTKISHSTPSL